MRNECEAKHHIVLMGFKHCGKSTLGKHLAGQLNMPFIDMDDEISLLYKDKNISPREIYKKEGSKYFKKLELKAVKKSVVNVSMPEKIVIALGGGIIDNKEGMKLIGMHGHLIYIQERPDVLYERITRKGIPAFFEADKDTYEQFVELYNKRSLEYEQYADDKIFIDNRELAAAREYLIRQLKMKGYVR